MIFLVKAGHPQIMRPHLQFEPSASAFLLSFAKSCSSRHRSASSHFCFSRPWNRQDYDEMKSDQRSRGLPSPGDMPRRPSCRMPGASAFSNERSKKTSSGILNLRITASSLALAGLLSLFFAISQIFHFTGSLARMNQEHGDNAVAANTNADLLADMPIARTNRPSKRHAS
jgi:hypothetical protein